MLLMVWASTQTRVIQASARSRRPEGGPDGCGHPRCCGPDLHKQTVVACVFVSSPAGQPAKTLRTFGTLTDELLALGDWLANEGVTHVALEATGAYWKRVGNLNRL